MKKKMKMLWVCVMTFAMLVIPAAMIRPVSAESAGGVTVYFQNTLGWNSVYCYTWGGTGTIGEAWPGAVMTAVSGHENWYSFTYNSTSPLNAIFGNNSGAQTANHTPADLPVATGTYWFVPSTETETTAGGYASGNTIAVYTKAQTGWPGYVAEATATPTASAATTSAPGSTNPKTGDNSFAGSFGFMSLAVLLSGLCVIKIRRNKKSSEKI